MSDRAEKNLSWLAVALLVLGVASAHINNAYTRQNDAHHLEAIRNLIEVAKLQQRAIERLERAK